MLLRNILSCVLLNLLFIHSLFYSFISITKSKSSASSIVVPSINGAQFLNATCVTGAVTTVISQRLDFKISVL